MKDTKPLRKLIEARREADGKIRHLDKKQRDKLNLELDVEHAYYSSALEGSQLDRKTFDELAKTAK
jgi:hypothetical protein